MVMLSVLKKTLRTPSRRNNLLCACDEVVACYAVLNNDDKDNKFNF